MTNANHSIHAQISGTGTGDYGETYTTYQHSGLTKREYFAAMAMQGMLSACNGVSGNQHGEADHIANCALLHADALINKLNKQPL